MRAILIDLFWHFVAALLGFLLGSSLARGDRE